MNPQVVGAGRGFGGHVGNKSGTDRGYGGFVNERSSDRASSEGGFGGFVVDNSGADGGFGGFTVDSSVARGGVGGGFASDAERFRNLGAGPLAGSGFGGFASNAEHLGTGPLSGGGFGGGFASNAQHLGTGPLSGEGFGGGFASNAQHLGTGPLSGGSMGAGFASNEEQSRDARTDPHLGLGMGGGFASDREHLGNEGALTGDGGLFEQPDDSDPLQMLRDEELARQMAGFSSVDEEADGGRADPQSADPGAGVGLLLGIESREAPAQGALSLGTDCSSSMEKGGPTSLRTDEESAQVPHSESMAVNHASTASGQKPPLLQRHGSVTSDDKSAPTLYLLARSYAEKGPVQCPVVCASACVAISLLITVIGMMAFPVQIEYDFASFMKTDVNSSTMREGFLQALAEREVRRLSDAENTVTEDMDEMENRTDFVAQEDKRVASSTDLFKLYDIQIAYVATDGENMIDMLGAIQAFEKELLSLPAYEQMCNEVWEQWRPLCNPGVSAVNYMQPTTEIQHGEVVPSLMKFDGSGDKIPMATALRVLEEYKVRPVAMPKDFQTNTDKLSASMMRSSFRFKIFCCSTSEGPAARNNWLLNQDSKWADFIRDAMLPFLKQSQFTYDGMTIYWEGTSIAGIEIMDTLAGDNKLAAGSVVVVILYLLIHTRSILLSLVAIILIALSVPMAYVMFAIIAGLTKMSIASFLSLFLVVGLGSDVVFVYTDFWRDSALVKETTKERVAWTYFHAGKATLATSATTAISFFANLASVLKPLREFGCFMGLCVSLVWILLSLSYIPTCVVDDTYFMSCRLCRTHQAPKNVGSTKLEWLTTNIYYNRKKCVIAPIIVAFLMFVWAALAIEVDTQVPNIFPEDHNQNRGKVVMSGFSPTTEVFDHTFEFPPSEAEICSETSFDKPECPLYWCEVQQGHTARKDGRCECWRKEKATKCTADPTGIAVTHIVGETVGNNDLEGPIGDYLVGGPEQISIPAPRVDSMATQKLAPIMLHEWEYGELNLRSMTRIETTFQRSSDGASCGWEEICYCGTYRCKFRQDQTPGLYEYKTSELVLRADRNQSAVPTRVGGRLLQGTTTQGVVQNNLRALIDVVLGLDIDTTTKTVGAQDEASWSFQITFEAQQPWAQRNLWRLCNDIPETMLVTEKRCWIHGFRTWLTDTDLGRFPVPASKFNSLVMAYIETGMTGLLPSKDYLWIRDGEVRACFMSFQIDVSMYADTDTALYHMDLWDGYLDEYNRGASRFARGAWHVAQLWVRAQAQEALMKSTVLTLSLVLIFAFGGMLIFTRSIRLSFFVVCATITVIGGLMWFVIVLMGWAVGPIEIIALIVFIGYAVTYSLHIAHKYGSAESLFEDNLGLEGSDALRYQRTVFAMKSIGGAALGSAITTAGCSIFLLFCTLTIFQKLGGVVLAVTLLSIFTALVPLPGILLVIGPPRPGCRGIPHPHEVVDNVGDNILSATKNVTSGVSNAYGSLPSRPKAPKMPQVPKMSLPKGAPPPKPPPPVPGTKAAPKAKNTSAKQTPVVLPKTVSKSGATSKASSVPAAANLSTSSADPGTAKQNVSGPPTATTVPVAKQKAKGAAKAPLVPVPKGAVPLGKQTIGTSPVGKQQPMPKASVKTASPPGSGPTVTQFSATQKPPTQTGS